MTDLLFKNNFRHDVLYIWDSKSPAPKNNWTTLLWNQNASKEDPNQLSVADLVENNSEELRARYLAWIYDLGESKINGKRIIDHLSLRPGFSYWWTTSLTQKFNCSGTSQINNSIKALALESLFLEGNIKNVVLNSDNIILADVIKSFCQKKNINFKFHKIKSSQKITYSNLLLKLLPGSITALIYLFRYVFRTLPFYFYSRSNMHKNIGDVIFFDILVHLDMQASNDGRFHSNYWTSLVNKLYESGIKTNWVHLFFKHPAVSNLSVARQLTDRFSLSSKGKEFHTLLEHPLTIKMLAIVLSDFFKIRGSINKLTGISEIRPASSDMDLWPFHENDWRRSLCGSETIDTCIKLSCFNSILSRVPKQRLGIYIAENQPWEMALIHAWKFHGHGLLIGAPHTTIRYWDLRYFYDARSYSTNKINDIPLPDFLAVNGPIARKTMIANNYPIKKLVKVEALRFLHLNTPYRNAEPHTLKAPLRVLVCGDFLEKTNLTILSWLDCAAHSLPRDTKYFFKPHPAYPLNLSRHSKIKFLITNSSLSSLVGKCDLALTSITTSAAVDLYCLGIPTIQVLEGGCFNTSPLRGMNISIVKNPQELIEAFILKLRNKKPKQYFYLDSKMSKWEKILKWK